MAFRKKAEHILAFKPDIVVVPECECPERLKFGLHIAEPKYCMWMGENPNKGLGVFSYSDYRIKLHDWYNSEFKTILPLSVSNGILEFTLFAIWANNPKDRDFQYVGQVWKAINHYESHLSAKRTIIVGDFNSNVIWDKNHRNGSHSEVVRFLEDKGIYSTYHQRFNQIQGKEEHPTLFLYRHQGKPYHIDYCFASKDLLENVTDVYLGQYDDWIKYSDHMPLIIDFWG